MLAVLVPVLELLLVHKMVGTVSETFDQLKGLKPVIIAKSVSLSLTTLLLLLTSTI